jgi:RNA polymerase sigma-70 factor (ECF subfamily)
VGVLRRLQPRAPEPAHDGEPLATLMRLVGRGDREAFAELYDAIAARVHGTVLRVVRDPAQAEEVTQEVFLELWRIAPRYERSRGSVAAWVATIAHRRAVDRVRSEQAVRDRTERGVDRADQPAGELADAVADAVVEGDQANFERGRVRRALGRLTEMQRQAVELAYFGGYTYREVAALLDVPEGTIKTRIRDGMIRLRDELGAAEA